MVDLGNIWNAIKISTALKIRIMKCLVWTVLTYGSDGWALRKQDEDRINSAEMWMYRKMLKVRWDKKRTNESIPPVLDELHIERELLTEIKKKKLSFFGHICRSKCTLMKDVVQGSLEAKRKHGRPRTHYTQNIREWTKRDMQEIYRTVDNRDEWREMVRKAMRAANTSGHPNPVMQRSK